MVTVAADPAPKESVAQESRERSETGDEIGGRRMRERRSVRVIEGRPVFLLPVRLLLLLLLRVPVTTRTLSPHVPPERLRPSATGDAPLGVLRVERPIGGPRVAGDEPDPEAMRELT